MLDETSNDHIIAAAAAQNDTSDAVPNKSATSSSEKHPAAMPVVVYLHGNGSCRVEAEVLFDHILPYGMSVFSLDFSGSGRSDGEYISLGVYEKHDVEAVVNYLSSCDYVSSIALWGHSMGAATATMYAGLVDPSCADKQLPARRTVNGSSDTARTFPRPLSLSFMNSSERIVRRRSATGTSGSQRASIDVCGHVATVGNIVKSDSSAELQNVPSRSSLPDKVETRTDETRNEAERQFVHNAKIRALVLDSAFASFEKLAAAMVETMPLPAGIPRRLVLSVGVRAVRKTVKEKAGFDVYDIDPLSACKKICPGIPAIFLQGTKDEIVHVSHAKLLFGAYPGRDKRLIIMENIDHDSPRPTSAIEKAFLLLQRSLFDDEGVLSLRYLNAVKLRGNDAMVEGRFADAIFLYSNALNALVTQERSAMDVQENQPLLSADDSASKNRGSQPTENGVTAALSENGSQKRETGGDSDYSDAWPASDDDMPGRERSRSKSRSFAASKWLPTKLTEAFSGLARKGSGIKRNANNGKRRERFGRRNLSRTDMCGDVTTGQQETSVTSKQEAMLRSGVRGDTSVDGEVKSSHVTDSTPRKISRFSGVLPRQRVSFSSRGFRRSFASSASATAMTPVDNEAREDEAQVAAKANSTDIKDERDDKVSAGDFIRAHGVGSERRDLALALLGNRSLARLRLNDSKGALSDAEVALEVDKSWIRGYQRKACALKHMGKLEDAQVCISEGMRVAPSSSTLQNMRVEVASAIATKVREARKSQTKAVPSAAAGQGDDLKALLQPTVPSPERSAQAQNVSFIVESDDDETDDSEPADPVLIDPVDDVGRPILHEKVYACEFNTRTENGPSAVF